VVGEKGGLSLKSRKGRGGEGMSLLRPRENVSNHLYMAREKALSEIRSTRREREREGEVKNRYIVRKKELRPFSATWEHTPPYE